jgi:hypothetical protein
MDNQRTAFMAKDMSGDSLYQQRARAALPILVRQAIAGQKMTYSQLAEEMGMPNPRNLNYVLGSVGTSLSALSTDWKQTIPPLQCLVVNSVTGLPGEGFDEFLDAGEAGDLTRKQRRALVNAALARVFAFPKWLDVAASLDVQIDRASFATAIESARSGGHGPESEQHRSLKEFVAANPAAVGLSAWFGNGQIEAQLPSGDLVDVLFRRGTTWIAVEVKSIISGEADVVRGLFQCVKYSAVIEAWRGSESEAADVRAILALGAALPPSLVPLRNALGVDVVENVGSRR